MSGLLIEQSVDRAGMSLEDYLSLLEVLRSAKLELKIKKIERLGGMTNRTYHLFVEGHEDVVVRLPGAGTETLINRADEEVSTKLANALGIDAPLYYFDEQGAKVSHYIQNAHTMAAKDMRKPKHIKHISQILSTLHTSGEDTSVPFEVFDMALQYENIILDNGVSLYDDYEKIKRKVMRIKTKVNSICGEPRVPCHNDPLCANWIIGEGRMFLVDWEYAGMNDPMWDLADVSIESVYTEKEDALLLKHYFGREVNSIEMLSFTANKIYLDYLWTLWGLTRVPFDHEMMQDYADLRYKRLKMNLKRFKKHMKKV